MKNITLVLIGLTSVALSEFISQNGIIQDNSSQLEWQNREIPELEWNNAQSYCSNLDLNGKGWRLPSKKELVSLIEDGAISTNLSAHSPFINHKNNGLVYWTSTATNGRQNQRWVVDFGRGWLGTRSEYWGFSVRCVRGKFQESLPLAQTFGMVGTESKPFSDEKEGIILLTSYGEPHSPKL